MNERQLNKRIDFFIEFMTCRGHECDDLYLIGFEFTDTVKAIRDGKVIYGNGSYSRKFNRIELKIQELNEMTKVLFHELCHAIDSFNKTYEDRENFAEIWSQKIYLRYINSQ